MSIEKPPTLPEAANILTEIVHSIRLTWRLFKDDRVPAWPKAIPIAGAAYVIFPLDLLMDPILGLGQLDDIAIAIMAVKIFIEVCPPEIVQEHREEIEGIVEVSYRVVSEDEEKGEEPPYPAIEDGSSR